MLPVSLCIAPQMPCYACMWHGGEGFPHTHGEPVHRTADAWLCMHVACGRRLLPDAMGPDSVAECS